MLSSSWQSWMSTVRPTAESSNGVYVKVVRSPQAPVPETSEVAVLDAVVGRVERELRSPVDVDHGRHIGRHLAQTQACPPRRGDDLGDVLDLAVRVELERPAQAATTSAHDSRARSKAVSGSDV
jgi:hypothetical protein